MPNDGDPEENRSEEQSNDSIRKLRIEREQFKASLNRFSRFLDIFTENQIVNLELRLKQLESTLLNEFNRVQDALELIDPNEINSDQRMVFENNYFELTGRAVGIVRNFYDNKSKQLSNNMQGLSLNASDQIKTGQHSTKGFPTIELIKFYGEYEKWSQFRDLYKTLVHEDPSIDKVRKFYYLVSSLKGDASKVLESIEITEQNYDLAWNLLTERYENKGLTIRNHIKALFELPTVSKDKYSLRNLLDDFQKRFRALKLLGEPVDSWSTLLIHLIVSKLDYRSTTQWEEFVINRNIDSPNLDDLLHFLSDRCKLLETTENQSRKNEKKDKQDFICSKRNKHSFTAQNSNFNASCAYCKEQHKIYHCQKLSDLPIVTRLEKIKELKLCINCLRGNHRYSDCIAQGCKICSKKHNTLLHDDEKANNGNSSKTEATGLSVNYSIKGESEVLLSTTVVLIKDRANGWHQCRALLDSGSQSNFVTENLAKKLNLELVKTNIPITGIGRSSSNILHRVRTEIKSSIDSNYNYKCHFLVLEKITGSLPSQSFDKSILNLPNNIVLADEQFNISKDVDLLLGVTIFYQSLEPEQKRLGRGLPLLQNTCFGWVLTGPLPLHATNLNCNFSTNNNRNNIEQQLQLFWKIDEYPIQKFHTAEESECEQIFIENLKRDSDGRFIVTLPITEKHQPLGESLDSAIKRLKSIERKFRKNPEFQNKYTDFMKEYEQLGHMEKIRPENVNIENVGNNLFYLPHHGVVKETSTTTSLRVVFDGSCQTTTGVSLNDILMVGPTIQDDLFAVLIRFRQHTVVITADVTKMYRQVKVSNEQRNLQRIVWRDSRDSEISHYQLTTVTYGTASAAFLATRALQQAALENTDKYPYASKIILADFYVDDLITGESNVSDAIKLKSEINEILSEYGFILRKWVSNYSEVIDERDQKTVGKVFTPENDSKRTLGLFWNAKADTLTYVIKNNFDTPKITKRIILSEASTIFDPLGLLAPIVVRAKLLMQQIWQLGEDWDTPLPRDICQVWLNLVEEFPSLNDIKINRQAVIGNSRYNEIHVFCDASQAAYGACIYIRSINHNNDCSTHLLCAKSRVAPLKTLTIPKLELCSAVIASKLCTKVQESLRLKINRVFFWTDSMIVLGWLSLSPSKLKIFVANRVAELQNHTDISQWNHVPSNENPADLLSRGAKAGILQNCNLWWFGPDWLQQYNTATWPNSLNIPQDLPEIKISKPALIVNTGTKFNIFDRFSNLFRLLRVLSYCYRFFYNCKTKSNKQSGNLTVQEINNSLTVLLKIAQSEMFPHELKAFKNSSKVDKKSKLLSLSPIMDPDGLLRVGGRISNSNLDFDTKHQIILSPKHSLTKLIILNEHLKNLHAGVNLILSSLREKYWILQGRRAIKSVLKNCTTCFRINPRHIIQKMGNLPADRVIQNRPFYVTGVDFAGPFLIKDGKLRNRSIVKAYLCIFICFTTKAVHLEAVGDLGSDSFLDALKRFVSRRGLSKVLYSDNGSNFKGANNELSNIIKTISEYVKEPHIADFLLKNAIQWNFIPPRSPHHGGLWEAAVKRAKYHIARTIGKTPLTFEKLATLFAQVEAAINSSPITPISDDPSDFTCLTPGHFLIGSPLLTVPDNDFTNLPQNRLSQYQALQQMFQTFWRKWSKDYLLNLQVRSKWSAQSDEIQLNSMVLVMEDNLPPLYWRIGRIVEIHPGKDNITRVVTVKTANGLITRAVQKLCLLPMEA